MRARPRILSGVIAAVALVLISTICRPAAAQSEKESDDEYKALIEQGVSEFDAGNWEEARALFIRAHRLKPNARTLRGLGMVEFELRHYVEAARLLAAALMDQRNPLTEEQIRQVEELLERTNGFIGRYNVELQPSTAVLVVDGESRAVEPGGWLMLDPGDHTVVVNSPGYKEQTLKLDVRGGEKSPLSISLEPELNTILSSKTDVDKGNVTGEWWFWTAIGVVVVGTVVIIAVATSGDEVQPPLPGDDGVIIRALTLP